MTMQDKAKIEAIIDNNSIEQVITALGDICTEKAEHIQTTWQDKTSAPYWERLSTRLHKLV